MQPNLNPTATWIALSDKRTIIIIIIMTIDIVP